ncbi:MAG: zf-HC2 domain-containing protein [Acidobacteria bacterium]|nr:zf-HC2 domain-containing protein [Acidobacteriota bacterium]
MVLNCRHVWDYISGYLDNTLDAQTRADVEKHLEHCEICSAVLDSTRNILILTADDRVFELPVGFSERLHARLTQAIAETPPDEPESSV